MGDVVVTVARTIRRHRLIGDGDRVAAAVSGGSDSVALAWLLKELAPETGAPLAGLIHVNHQLRGAESDADEQFCRDLAVRLDVPIDVRRRDVAAMARAQRVSLETAARIARYDCFREAAPSLGATAIATGHTEDDQAESVLLRLLRGAGTRGLSGIRVRRGQYVRPLLEVRREALQHHLRSLGEPWREDASNADPAIIRNRIRHELVPVLRDIAPGGVRALARLARLASDDEEFLTVTANEKGETLVLSNSEAAADTRHLAADAAAFGRLPAALGRRLARQFAEKVAPGVNLSAHHLEAVCELAATDKPGGRLDLPGLAVSKQGGRLKFAAAGSRTPDARQPWPRRPLPVPGMVIVPEAGVTIEARAAGAHERYEGGLCVVIPADTVATPLYVRNRLPGDRFRPLGAPGRRKLQDVLVDRKVPRQERDTVPIVIDANDEIVWVAGVAMAERCRIQSPSNGMLILELRKHR